MFLFTVRFYCVALQRSEQCELRGARPAPPGVGDTKHCHREGVLRGPQQPNHAVHRPAPLRQPASRPEVSPAETCSRIIWAAERFIPWLCFSSVVQVPMDPEEASRVRTSGRFWFGRSQRDPVPRCVRHLCSFRAALALPLHSRSHSFWVLVLITKAFQHTIRHKAAFGQTSDSGSGKRGCCVCG